MLSAHMSAFAVRETGATSAKVTAVTAPTPRIGQELHARCRVRLCTVKGPPTDIASRRLLCAHSQRNDTDSHANYTCATSTGTLSMCRMMTACLPRRLLPLNPQLTGFAGRLTAATLGKSD